MISWSFLFLNYETQVLPMAPMKLYPSEPAACCLMRNAGHSAPADPSGLARLSYLTAFQLDLL